jgi:hypothetical protein
VLPSAVALTEPAVWQVTLLATPGGSGRAAERVPGRPAGDDMLSRGVEGHGFKRVSSGLDHGGGRP